MDLLPLKSEVPRVSENKIYISATKKTNMNILREMIKWKANRIMNNFPYRFIHHQSEHQKRLSWLFEHGNFEDASESVFSFDRPDLFKNGYAFVDGYINDHILREYKKHFKNDSRFFGFQMQWATSFEEHFSHEDSGNLIEEANQRQMDDFLDLLEFQLKKEKRRFLSRKISIIKEKQNRFFQENQSGKLLRKLKIKRKEDLLYESSIRDKFNIPKSWK